MSDLPKRLRIKAGMIQLGEHIAWGSDAEIMEEAADEIERIEAERDQLRAELAEIRASEPEGHVLVPLDIAHDLLDESARHVTWAAQRALRELIDAALSTANGEQLASASEGVLAAHQPIDYDQFREDTENFEQAMTVQLAAQASRISALQAENLSLTVRLENSDTVISSIQRIITRLNKGEPDEQ